MTLDAPVLIAIGAALAAGVGGWVLVTDAAERARLAARVRLVSHGGEKAEPKEQVRPTAVVLRLLNRVGKAVMGSGLLPVKTVADLGASLSAAGYRASSALPIFVGAKVTLIVLLPILVILAMHALQLYVVPPVAAAGGGSIVGLLAPDAIVRKLRKSYLLQIENGLADALDMLIICAEAGLPLEGGIERVSTDMRGSNKPIATEFEIIAAQMKILPDRKTALINAGTRTGVEGFVRLGATLAQSMQYGTPIAKTLRTLAAESRAQLVNRFEASAARLPVLLTLPMITCILPTVFIVTAGPAVIQALITFRGH